MQFQSSSDVNASPKATTDRQSVAANGSSSGSTPLRNGRKRAFKKSKARSPNSPKRKLSRTKSPPKASEGTRKTTPDKSKQGEGDQIDDVAVMTESPSSTKENNNNSRSNVSVRSSQIASMNSDEEPDMETSSNEMPSTASTSAVSLQPKSARRKSLKQKSNDGNNGNNGASQSAKTDLSRSTRRAQLQQRLENNVLTRKRLSLEGLKLDSLPNLGTSLSNRLPSKIPVRNKRLLGKHAADSLSSGDNASSSSAAEDASRSSSSSRLPRRRAIKSARINLAQHQKGQTVPVSVARPNLSRPKRN